MTTFTRWLKHLSHGRWHTNRMFPRSTLDAIERAVRNCESRHSGEIRFVVEGALPLDALRARQTPRERAIDVFARLRIWDTEHRNGVLIYVLLADRDVEIVADRGVAGGHVPQTEWERVAQIIEAHFRERRFERGAVAGIEAVAALLAQNPVSAAHWRNHLPDAPLILP